jgi:hypothetical protein
MRTVDMSVRLGMRSSGGGAQKKAAPDGSVLFGLVRRG